MRYRAECCYECGWTNLYGSLSAKFQAEREHYSTCLFKCWLGPKPPCGYCINSPKCIKMGHIDKDGKIIRP